MPTVSHMPPSVSILHRILYHDNTNGTQFTRLVWQASSQIAADDWAKITTLIYEDAKPASYWLSSPVILALVLLTNINDQKTPLFRVFETTKVSRPYVQCYTGVIVSVRNKKKGFTYTFSILTLLVYC